MPRKNTCYIWVVNRIDLQEVEGCRVVVVGHYDTRIDAVNAVWAELDGYRDLEWFHDHPEDKDRSATLDSFKVTNGNYLLSPKEPDGVERRWCITTVPLCDL